MQAIVIGQKVYGPYKSAVAGIDRYYADNEELPFNVVGQGEIVDASTVQWPVDLPALKLELKAMVTAIYTERSEIPVDVGGVLITAFDGPLMELIGAKVGSKANRKFVTSLGQRVQLTQAQLNAMFDAIDTHKQALRDREYDLYEAIDAATTKAQLDAINVNAGWP